MKKILIIVLTLLVILSFAACNAKKNYGDPKIIGVKDTATVSTGTEFNALDGVTATDDIDGTITDKITITSTPALNFVDGKVTPDAIGTYEITYSIKNLGNKEANAYCTLTVTKKTTTETVFKQYDFTDNGTVDLQGWGLSLAGTGAGTAAVEQGQLKLNITNIGSGDGDVKFTKNDISVEAGVTYEYKVYMSASKKVKFHFLANDGATDWSALDGSKFNLEVDTGLIVQSIKFTPAVSSTNFEVMLNMGALANPAAGFSLFINKIQVIKSVNKDTEIFTNDFTDANAIDNVGLDKDADVTAAYTNDSNALKVNIGNYPASGSSGIKLHQNTKKGVTTGETYKISYDINAKNVQPYTLCFEDSAMNGTVSAGHIDGKFKAGDTKYSYYFVASCNITELYIKWELGTYDTDVTSNIIVIDNISLVQFTAPSETTQYQSNFATAPTDSYGIAIDAAATAAATAAVTADGLVYNITKYPDSGNAWDLNCYVNTKINIKSGSTYRFVCNIGVLVDQNYELCFEDSTMDWQIRAGFNKGTLLASDSMKDFEYTFIANMNITGLYIKLSAGNHGTNTANTITIKDESITEVVGSLDVSNENLAFVDANAEWGTYNGSDDGNKGVGTVYTDNGHLIYNIAEVGDTDWYNKLYIKKINLEADALYKVSFTVKASKAVKCMFALNKINDWPPRISEVINIATGETTFAFTTTKELVVDMDFELLFQFGFTDNAPGPVTVDFSNLTIYQLK